MAGGRYSRVDARKPSGNGSTVTIVVFIALCLVGIWVMTSSSLMPIQNSRVPQDSKNVVTIEDFEGNVENNNDSRGIENSNIAMEDNSNVAMEKNAKGKESSNVATADDAKDNENSNVATADSAKDNENSNVATADNTKENENSNVAMEGNAKDNENSNIASEDNTPRDEGKQKQFDDSQGHLPEDAIKVDKNERSDQAEKNDDGPDGMGKTSEDKMKGDDIGNKAEKLKDVSENDEEKKVDGESQVERKDSKPEKTTENNFDSVKKSENNSGKTGVEKQGDQIESKNYDNEKRPEENSGNTVLEKPEDQIEEKLVTRKDDSEKRSDENSGNTEVKIPQDRVEEKVENKIDEKVENKTDDTEDRPEENSGKTVVEKQADEVQENIKNKQGDSGKISKQDAGKTDMEKQEDWAEKSENNKDNNEKIPAENLDKMNVTQQEDHKDRMVEKKKDEKPDQGSIGKKDRPSEMLPSGAQSDEKPDQGSIGKKDRPIEMLPSGAQSELLKESATQNGSFSTQASMSKNEKEIQKSSTPENQNNNGWKLCKTTAGPDYIPCLDNMAAISKLRTTKHYEHRERHCPESPPTCLIPIPQGYKRPIEWPNSRDKIWYHNVPHTKLAEFKGHQNWVKVSGEFLTFPGGGTQFKHGALLYIDHIQESVPEIAWGKQSRVVLDVGCGVASFGGFLFDRDVLTMSLAPKDEHEAQVQFALERGIPAISAVMGTKRLPYPARVFDVVHCARCRVPWHIDGGKLLLELNRLLRPGGFFVWSATPVYQKLPEDVEIWEAMKKLTKAMCWEIVTIIKDKINGVGIAIFRKPASDECYEKRPQNEPPLCPDTDNPNGAWNVPLQACVHKIPVDPSQRGSKWPEQWPARVEKVPYWLSSTEVGAYGKPAPEDFKMDYEHWKRVVKNSYLNGLGIKWSHVRNVMDMRAVYGGLAAALRDLNIWVMNVVSVDAPDTLPIIYERGLFGIYHDWCESFSTYPRSYDLLHADHLFSKIKKKCNITALVAETDRILRPEGKIIVRDTADTIAELKAMFKSLHWNVRMTYSKNKEGLVVAKKTMWRPTEEEELTYAIAAA